MVKVSEVTNLSDARYCAGMGVEMISFVLDENHPKFLQMEKILEITNWVSGIKVVGEFSGTSVKNINYLAEQLNLDLVQLDAASFHEEKPEKIKLPVILKIPFETLEVLHKIQKAEHNSSDIAYLQLVLESKEQLYQNLSQLKEVVHQSPTILDIPSISKEDILEIIDILHPAGINLQGGSEDKPGMRDFSDLSELLEMLEEDN